MTKSIAFKKKHTTANTQYNETNTSDLKHVLEQSQRIVDVATMCEQQGVIEGQRLYSSNGIMPRQSSGKMNSCKSMCEGVLENFTKGQYTLSEKQMEGLTEAFKVASEVIEDFEDITFTEVDELPKIKSKPVDPNILKEINTTFSDLWDWEVESVTLTRRKQ